MADDSILLYELIANEERIRQLEELLKEVNQDLVEIKSQNQPLRPLQSKTLFTKKLSNDSKPPTQIQRQQNHDVASPSRFVSSEKYTIKQKFRTFNKRSGTVDAGKKFEELMCGLYALKLCLNDDVEDFEMTSNNNDCGDFDDIEIMVAFKSGKKRRFLFQLKHKDNPQVLKEEHFEDKKSFLAQKYLKSVSEIQNKDDVFILYTNNKVDFKDNTVLKNGIEVRPCDGLEHANLLLNSKKTSDITNLVFEFKSSNSTKFYLFAQQYDVKAVEHELREMLSNLLKCDIYSSLSDYLNKWWSQNYVLTKHDFIAKLTEVAISPFIKRLADDNVNEKTKSLREAVMKFEMTIVENGEEDALKNIWTIEKHKDINKCQKQFALYKNNDLTTSKTLWYLEKAPLIVNVDDRNKPIIKAVLALLHKDLGQKKVLLYGKVTKEDFENWNIFESLWDLRRQFGTEELQSKMTKNFKVSFQGRPGISLEQLISIDEDITKHVKTKELFKMSQEECYLIGEVQKEMQKWHIPRNVRKFDSQNSGNRNIVSETEIYGNFKNNLNTFCAPPGVGKSRMMHVLNNLCPSDCWAFHINLIKCNEFLAKYIDDDDETNKIIKQILNIDQEEKLEDELAKQIKVMLLEQRKAHIFLDGLDEIDSKYVDTMLKCVEHMKQEGFNVWMSSRENLRERIKQNLKTEFIEIQELNPDQQRKYIRERLESKYEKTAIATIADVLFKSVHVNNSQQLLGIPLQLHIVTEIFLHNENAYEKMKKENMFVLTQMYQLFFEAKEEVKYKKLGIDENLKSQLGTNFKNDLEQYEIPALKSCLDKSDFEVLTVDESKAAKFLDDLKKNGDKYGIIKVVNDDGVAIFEHQTFAEYFVCAWFKKNKGKIQLLKHKFFSPKYDNLRRIFDILMAENNPLHLAVIYQNIDLIRKHLDTKFDNVDEGGRTALHLACTYGNSVDLAVYSERTELVRENSVYKKMIDLLALKCKDIRHKDSLFDFDYLEYAIHRGSFYLLEKLVEIKLLKFDQIKDARLIQSSNFTIVLTRLGYSNLLTEILRQTPELTYKRLKDVYKDEDENDTFLLHMAIKGCTNDDYRRPRTENIATVKILLSKMKDINDAFVEESHYSLNPLDYACYHRYYDMFEILTQNGAKCSQGNTLLHQISRWQTIDENVLKIVKNYNIDINARNDKGLTALHYVILNNSATVTEISPETRTADVLTFFFTNYLIQVLMKNHQIRELSEMNAFQFKSYNEKGETILKYEVANNFTELASTLSERGPNLNIVQKLINLKECLREESETTKFLKTMGMTLNVRTESEKTAFEFRNINQFFKNYVNLLESKLFKTFQNNTDIEALSCFTEDEKKKCEKMIEIEKLLEKEIVGLNFQTQCLNNVKHLHRQNVDFTIVDNYENSPLHYASMSKNENSAVIDFLLKRNININIRNKSGETPLHSACIIGCFKNVEYLHRQNADFTIADEDGFTPLHFASMCKNDNSEVIDFLMKRNIDINVCNKSGNTPLHFACIIGCFKNVECLHQHKADFTFVDDVGNTSLHFASMSKNYNFEVIDFLLNQDLNINARNKFGQTPLHEACLTGCFKNVEHLHGQNADITIVDEFGNTSLHFAARSKTDNSEVMDFLLKENIAINARNKFGETPLQTTCLIGCFENVQYLYQQKADFTTVNEIGNTLLHIAAMSKDDNLKVIDFLLKQNIPINVRNTDGVTPLHYACENACYKNVEHLHLQKADITMVDEFGNTSLHFAAQSKTDNSEVMDFLLKENIDINVRTKSGTTPLQIACFVGCFENVQYLYQQKADFTIVDEIGNTLLHVAAMSTDLNLNVIYFLLKQNIPINVRNNDGITPLHYACQNACYKIVEHLHLQKADITIVDEFGNTPLHFAALSKMDNSEVIDFLLKENIDINVRSKYDTTPLHLACLTGCFKNVQHLYKQKADFTIVDENDNTPLHYASACKDDNLKVIDLLLQHIPYINIPNKSGKTPLQLASESGCLKNAKHLHGYNADLTTDK